MPLHKLPLIMVSNVQENAVFRHKFLKNLPTVGGGNHTLPPLGRFAPSLWPPLTNPGCTTAGIAKGTRGHAPAPLIGVK